jgi:hypothetical protein
MSGGKRLVSRFRFPVSRLLLALVVLNQNNRLVR